MSEHEILLTTKERLAPDIYPTSESKQDPAKVYFNIFDIKSFQKSDDEPKKVWNTLVEIAFEHNKVVETKPPDAKSSSEITDIERNSFDKISTLELIKNLKKDKEVVIAALVFLALPAEHIRK